MVALRLAKTRVAVMSVLRALIAGVLMVGCLSGSAHSQKPEKTPLQLDDEQKKKDAEAIDRQYKSTLDRTRKGAVVAPVSDPWQSMRGTDDTKTKR